MPDLSFEIVGVEPQRTPVIPQLLFRLRIAEAAGSAVQSVQLRCQVRIEPARRRYAPEEQARLSGLFGTPDRWDQTVRDMHWSSVMVDVPGFAKETSVALPVPCSPEEPSAASRYFEALSEGEVSLSFLFSGTVFYEDPAAGLQVAPIPWEREARFRLPVALWKQLVQETAT